MFQRVAEAVAAVEERYGGNAKQAAAKFHEAMARLEFLPNSPALMNAGTRSPQLAACFVLPVLDTLSSIFSAVRDAALIHQSGGGVGCDFSLLRPRGDPIASTGGVSSGPLAFIRVFDAATDAIRQGGRRRGASMGVLSVYHPDIEEFVSAKQDPHALASFNLSVACDDAFMDAVSRERDIWLVNPRTGRPTSRRDAAALFNRIAECACRTGEPGVIFIDRINRANPTPALGRITATNPCGEVPLLPYEACVLGSINLSRVVRGGQFDWNRLGELVELGVRFLDDCIDASVFPLPQIHEAVRANRKIGLGIMGWADALVDLGIAYDDTRAVSIAEEVMRFIDRRALDASRSLASSRGAFPNFDVSVYGTSGDPPLRNATRTAIAPTGTLSLIAGCSSGIEPYYALAWRRRALDGSELSFVNARFDQRAGALGVDTRTRSSALQRGRIRDDERLPAELRHLFPVAAEIDVDAHVRVQAAFQAHVDNAVSKTLLLPPEATADDAKSAFETAFALGCKGVTVYREGARVDQVLTSGAAAMTCPVCGLDRDVIEGCTFCRSCGLSEVT
jgi:ribonucleoside-diphosphate reductase alpha chain